MKKAISFVIALCVMLSAFTVSVSADAADIAVTASRITRNYAILTFNTAIDSQEVKINGAAVTGTPVSYTADVSADGAVTEQNTYEYKIDGGYALDTVYTVSVDSNPIYQFKLNKLFEDDFTTDTSANWEGGTIDTNGGTMTVAGNSTAYYKPSIGSDWADYVLEADINKDTVTGARMSFRKYAEKVDDTASLSYLVRDFQGKLLYYIQKTSIEGSSLTQNDFSAANTKNIQSGPFRCQIGFSNKPWKDKVSTIYTMYEFGNKAYLDLNGETQLMGNRVTTNTIGGIGIKMLDAQSAILNKICAYKVVTNDPTTAAPLSVESILCTSDKIQLTYNTEPFETPTVAITDLDGTDVSAEVTTSGRTTTIASDNIESGTLYKLSVGYAGHSIDRYFRKTLRFEDDCTGTDVSAKWSAWVEGDASGLMATDYVSYTDKTLKFAGNKTIIITPKDTSTTICSGTQVFEYTVKPANSVDYMGFSKSESVYYLGTDNKSMFCKFDGNGMRMKHTFNNSAYWNNGTGTPKLAANISYKMVQTVSGNKFDVYKDGVLALSNTNDNVPTHGRFGFRVCGALEISDIKVVDFELFNSIPSAGISTTNFAIAPDATKWGVDTTKFTYNAYVNNFDKGGKENICVIAAFYDANDNLVGCDIKTDAELDKQISGTAKVSAAAAYGRLFAWDAVNGSLTPLCADTKAER